MANPTERTYCNLADGKKVSMPRYYKDKIFGSLNIVNHETGEVTVNPVRAAISAAGQERAHQASVDKKNAGGASYFRDQLEKKEYEFRKMKLDAKSRNKI